MHKKNVPPKAFWNVHKNHESPGYIKQMKILMVNNLILLWIVSTRGLMNNTFLSKKSGKRVR